MADNNNINPDKLTFQILDWDYFHEENEEGTRKFCMRLFGKSKDQKTVYLQVNDFTPYFYVEMNSNWRLSMVAQLMGEIKKKVSKDHVEGLKKYVVEEKYKFWGFTNYKKFNFIKLTFNDFDSMKAYARAFTWSYKIYSLSKRPIKFKLYESNILPILRFMHIKQLEAVGWISISTNKLNEFEYAPTCCDLNYKTVWQNIEKVDDRLIEKFVIAAFDIECKSEDGSFPQPQRLGDKIIQIGVTLSRFGESECFYKHILCLKKTSNVEGVTVEWFNTEEELLLSFTKLIRKLNPDIITGYNIFGFDFDYLMERSKKLDIAHKFARLSRVNNELSEWVETGLSSAALGTNILKYYKMTGRVIIDLMKVVQRDYKLSSYKLDFVASYFIREKIEEIDVNKEKNTFKIKTKNTFGLYLDQYVVIMYIEGAVENKYNDGQKFKIQELGDNYIIAKGTVDPNEFLGKGYKSFWCQAKDDISPNDIFRMCDGTPDERAIIAKYCVMDCVLCNKLVAKLQVVTNNVSMANVCNVPLSYLFLRGQGVKIFSLVSKKCREKNHVIPVIQKKEKKKDKQKPDEIKKEIDDEKKEARLEKTVYHLNNKNNNQDEDSDDDVGYEGAIVIIPEAGVYYEPIPVLDYASLYPNAMILRNLSHECFVNDPEYDNLTGYKYHVISYKNNDGTFTTCRFAEKLDGTKGIMPEILTDLLSARKKYKKLMEEEKDPFKKSILDSLQLAYKVTANSLYGQTGAGTSPVCMKEIAASTTATGREMLLFSKYFIENYFAELIKLALSDKDKYLEKANKLYEYYPTTFTVDDVAVDEKTKVKTKITHDIHVCTDKNSKIPESKFVQRDIGYELECELYNDFKKTSKFYDNYKEMLVKLGYSDNTVFNDKFVKSLKSVSVVKRREFYDDLADIVLKKKKKKNGFYKKHKDLLKQMGFDESDYEDKFHKRLTKMDDDTSKTFMKILKDNISNMGCANRNDLFEAFYNMINDELSGYETRPEIIYGDSVTGDTPLLLKDNLGNCVVKRIDKLCTEWYNYDGFKTDKANEYFFDIIDQLLKPNMKLLNEQYDNTYIDGTKIMHYDLDDGDIFYNVNIVKINKFCELVMQKMLNKLPKKYHSRFDGCATKHINGDTSDIRRCNLKYVKQDCDDIEKFTKDIKNDILNDNKEAYSKEQSKTDYLVWSGKEWTKIKRVIRHKTNKKIYRVITKTSTIDVTEDHSLIDTYGNYIKPNDCNETTLLMQSYPENVNFKVNHNDIKCKLTFSSKNSEECMKYYIESVKKGFNIELTYDEQTKKFALERTQKNIQNSNKIIKIIELKTTNDEYVYDLETESGHFHAGVGEIIVKNTDSVFFRMNITDSETKQKVKNKDILMKCITCGIWASLMICSLLPNPMQQCYEKVLYPFCIQGKKRYVGNLYEKNPNIFYQKSMGIELKRRDNAPIVKIICAGIIDQILNKHSSEGAYKFTKDTLHKIITGKYKMDKFIISKTLKGNALSKNERRLEQAKPKEQRSYANRESIVHAVLADRMADRSYGDKPRSNDRIMYVYIETKEEPKLQGERVETPEYIIENKLKIDYLFYITNQIMKPALKFLDLIINNAENVFNEYIIKEENRKQCMMPIAYYANKDGDDNSDNDNVKDFIDFDNLPQMSKASSDKKKKTTTKIAPKSHKKKTIDNTNIINLNNLMNDNMDESSDSDSKAPKKKSSKKSEKNPTKKKSSGDKKKGSKKDEIIYVSTNDLFS